MKQSKQQQRRWSRTGDKTLYTPAFKSALTSMFDDEPDLRTGDAEPDGQYSPGPYWAEPQSQVRKYQ
jgi:hypothetical protein